MDWREKANAFQLKYYWEVINNYFNALSNGKIVVTIVGVISLTVKKRFIILFTLG